MDDGMAPVDTFGIDVPVNPTAQTIATIVTALIAIGMVSWTLLLCRRERIWWPLLILVGGTMTCYLEPLYDHLYGLWFNAQGQWNAFVTYGIHIPVWLPMIYIAYYGGCTMLFWYRMHNGATMRHIALHFALSAALAGIAEQFYITVTGLYIYQDHQPFYFLGYPWFVAIVNGVPPMLSGIILYRLVPILTGWSRWILLFVVPFSFAANSFGSGWLYLAYRHSTPDPSMLVISLLAILTTILSIAVIWTAARLAGVPASFAAPDRERPARPVPVAS
jgi:hypothetical protein